jgi:hypothetical protein
MQQKKGKTSKSALGTVVKETVDALVTKEEKVTIESGIFSL